MLLACLQPNEAEQLAARLKSGCIHFASTTNKDRRRLFTSHARLPRLLRRETPSLPALATNGGSPVPKPTLGHAVIHTRPQNLAGGTGIVSHCAST